MATGHLGVGAGGLAQTDDGASRKAIISSDQFHRSIVDRGATGVGARAAKLKHATALLGPSAGFASDVGDAAIVNQRSCPGSTDGGACRVTHENFSPRTQSEGCGITRFRKTPPINEDVIGRIAQRTIGSEADFSARDGDVSGEGVRGVGNVEAAIGTRVSRERYSARSVGENAAEGLSTIVPESEGAYGRAEGDVVCKRKIG